VLSGFLDVYSWLVNAFVAAQLLTLDGSRDIEGSELSKR
jgi:hypothetical protein